MNKPSKSNANVSEIHERRGRRRRYSIFAIMLLAIYVIVLALAWLVFRSPVFRIKNITIIGNERTESGQILSLLQSRISKTIFGLNNILAWPDELAGNDLSLLPTLKNLEIKKNFWARSIVVRVEERGPYGIWCYLQTQNDAELTQNDADLTQNNAEQTQNGAENFPQPSASIPLNSAFVPHGSAPSGCWLFDKDGVIFQKSLSVEGGLITAVDDYSQESRGLNSKILPDEFVQNMFSIFDVLNASGITVKDIRLNDLALQEIEADTFAGPKLYFSLRFPSTDDLEVLQSFLSRLSFKKLQYLDFRVENRAYYR